MKVHSTHVDLSYDLAPKTNTGAQRKAQPRRFVPGRGQAKMSSSTSETSCQEEYVGSPQDNLPQIEAPLPPAEESPGDHATATVPPSVDDAVGSRCGGDDTAYEADVSESNPTANTSSAQVDPPARSDLDGDRLYRFVRENHQKLK